MYNPIERIITKVGDEDPLLLAHHPTCEYYSHHVVEVYGQKLCMGCFIVYPVSFLALSTLLSLRLTMFAAEIAAVSTLSLYAIGSTLILPKVVAKIAPGQRSRRTRISSKASLAVGLAFVAFPFFFRPADRLVTVALFFGFLVPYIGYKALTVTDDCAGCPEVDDFPNCSGLTFDGTYRYAENDSVSGDDGQQ